MVHGAGYSTWTTRRCICHISAYVLQASLTLAKPNEAADRGDGEGAAAAGARQAGCGGMRGSVESMGNVLKGHCGDVPKGLDKLNSSPTTVNMPRNEPKMNGLQEGNEEVWGKR